jgi:aryl-alcohol dehydrogenase-like predicted oxidoreductase
MGGFAARTLGATGLSVGPLGIGSSFGIGGRDLEWAFDRGCNYLYWGSLRRGGFGDALRNLAKTRRDDLVLVVQSYARWGRVVRWSLERALRRLRTDHTDVLLLGMWNGAVKPAVLAAAARLREEGKARFVAVSTHERTVAGCHLAGELGGADILHIRYNAAHRGAEEDVFPQAAPEPADRPGIVNFTATRWGTLMRPDPAEERTPTAGDCYRFALTRPEVDLCLTGPRNRADVVAALEAVAKGPMDEEELAWMRRVGDRIYAARRGKGDTGFLSR